MIKERKTGQLIVISAPSGAGKGTIINALLKKNKNCYLSVSTTTREKRKNDIPGVTYNFVSKEEFEQKIKEDYFLEYTNYIGNYYGTPKGVIKEKLDEGQDVILEIEIEGAKQVMAKCPDAITIFMVPPSFEELEKRIRGRRSEPEDIIQQRLAKAKREMKLQNDYKYVVINDSISRVSDEITNIIETRGNVL